MGEFVRSNMELIAILINPGISEQSFALSSYVYQLNYLPL